MKMKIAVCVLALATTMLGCYRKPAYAPPEVYPVSGKVVADGGNLPRGSTIQFVPDNPEYTAEGILEDDGTFTLKMLFHEEWIPGATVGKHRVQVLVPLGPDRRGGQTLSAGKPCTVEPKENHFSITVR